MLCPVCHADSEFHPTSGDRQEITCSVCGMFEITGTAQRVLEVNPKWTALKRAVLSHRIRLDQGQSSPPRIDTYLMERVLEGAIKLPSPPAQAQNLLRYVGDNVLESGGPLPSLERGIHAVIGSPTAKAAHDIAVELVEQGILKAVVSRTFNGTFFGDVQPTLGGWQIYERERTGKEAGNVAIIAMKFNDPDLDAFVDSVVKPAARDAGYELERISDRPRAGVIDQIMRVKIRDAPFVIAELSHDNCGAYWEAGFAEGLGKPVIYLCHKDKWAEARTHFDTNHCETIDWHPNEASTFQERLVAIIRNSMAASR